MKQEPPVIMSRGPRLFRRRLGAWFFITLVLIVSAEGRVAELDLGLDDELAYEDAAGFDGGDILSRLIVVEDIRLPQAPDATRLPIMAAVLPNVPPVPSLELATRASRAPPLSRTV